VYKRQLQTKDLDKIPGCISKDMQEYTNHNSSLNLLINIFIQPASGDARNVEFDANTTIALKEMIMTEMV